MRTTEAPAISQTAPPEGPTAWKASTRFGLGPRPDEAPGDDPRGWLLAQIEPQPIPAPMATLPTSGEILRELVGARSAKDNGRASREKGREHHDKEATAWARVRVSTTTPFRERLVDFWCDWFTVSGLRAQARGLVGAHAREAIRPHVTGRFSDMLLASTRHPAMLFYLDNVQSVGPSSSAGRRGDRGLNENLAREILELHTVGAAAHDQADVAALAALLTGWSVDIGRGQPTRLDEATGFAWFERRHQPGGKRLLDRRYGEGEEAGVAALADLAARPETAQRVGQAMAEHFVSDRPPRRLVDALAGVFLETGGDLKALAAALVNRDEPWAPGARKLRSPRDLVTAAARGVGAGDGDAEGGTAESILRSLRLLEQPQWMAPSPKGWPDDAASWLGPSAVVRRVEWAATIARRIGARDPRPLIAGLLGDGARDETRRAVDRAGSEVEGLSVLLAAPEFQWR